MAGKALVKKAEQALVLPGWCSEKKTELSSSSESDETKDVIETDFSTASLLLGPGNGLKMYEFMPFNYGWKGTVNIKIMNTSMSFR